MIQDSFSSAALHCGTGYCRFQKMATTGSHCTPMTTTHHWESRGEWTRGVWPGGVALHKWHLIYMQALFASFGTVPTAPLPCGPWYRLRTAWARDTSASSRMMETPQGRLTPVCLRAGAVRRSEGLGGRGSWLVATITSALQQLLPCAPHTHTQTHTHPYPGEAAREVEAAVRRQRKQIRHIVRVTPPLPGGS